MWKSGERVLGALIVLALLSGSACAETPEEDRIRTAREAAARRFCEAVLSVPDAEPFKYAFAAFYLDRNVAEANERILQEIDDIAHTRPQRMMKKDARGKTQEPDATRDWPDHAALNAEQAGSEYVKWKARTVIAVYFLFGDKGLRAPGRLSPKTQTAMEELLFQFACRKSVLARLDNVWVNNSSENHEMMANASAFLAVQAVKDCPAYAKRKLPDGKTLGEHYEGWVRHFRTYCRERARWGLFWEIHSPTYGKWFLPDLMNIADFANDPELRADVGKLLHVVWADWALAQLDLVTGGAKTRCYLGHYSADADADSWRQMARCLCGEDPAFLTSTKGFAGLARHNTAHQFPLILYTTRYRIPQLVLDLIRERERKGAYVYRATRPARQRPLPEGFPTEVYEDPKNVRLMWAEDSRCVTYTYATPHFVLGSIWVDPKVEYEAGPRQNRWMGAIFDSQRDARVFPQCVSTHSSHEKNYNQHVSVQHENVMIVAKNTFSSKEAGASRVFFAKGMRSRLERHAGWYCLVEGASYVAVKPFPYGATDGESATWDDETWLRLTDEAAPIVLVCSDQTRFETPEAFQSHLDTHDAKVTTGNRLDYTFPDSRGRKVTLTLFKDVKKLPCIDGAELDLAPDFTFDSPFLKSSRASGKISVRLGEREMNIDFPE